MHAAEALAAPRDLTEGTVAVHSRMVGHSRAVTSISFNLLEDQLITSSIDKTVRIWGVDSGQMLRVFTDRSHVLVVTYLPLNPQLFAAANSSAKVRIANSHDGTVTQTLRMETVVYALQFDNTG